MLSGLAELVHVGVLAFDVVTADGARGARGDVAEEVEATKARNLLADDTLVSLFVPVHRFDKRDLLARGAEGEAELAPLALQPLAAFGDNVVAGRRRTSGRQG